MDETHTRAQNRTCVCVCLCFCMCLCLCYRSIYTHLLCVCINNNKNNKINSHNKTIPGTADKNPTLQLQLTLPTEEKALIPHA